MRTPLLHPDTLIRMLRGEPLQPVQPAPVTSYLPRALEAFQRQQLAQEMAEATAAPNDAAEAWAEAHATQSNAPDPVPTQSAEPDLEPAPAWVPPG